MAGDSMSTITSLTTTGVGRSLWPILLPVAPSRGSVKTMVRVLLGLGCFIMGGLTLSGLFLRDDPKGRWICGIGWILIGVGWLGRWYVGKKKSEQKRKEENGS
jgi:hypothetical protein